MKKIRFLFYLSCCVILSSFTSCRTIAPAYNYRTLAKASIKLGMDIDRTDHHPLYIESARWIGTPYRSGGDNKRGTDCSGLTTQIYKKVYHIRLERSSEEQRKKNCHKIKKKNLKEGDLVFFSNQKKKREATHAGIYLKNNKFIHASTSRGVIISDLDETYYRKTWLSGGRVK